MYLMACSTRIGKGGAADFKVFTDYHTESGSWIMKLNANDYVEMKAIMSAPSLTKNFKEESFWSGYLLVRRKRCQIQ